MMKLLMFIFLSLFVLASTAFASYSLESLAKIRCSESVKPTCIDSETNRAKEVESLQSTLSNVSVSSLERSLLIQEAEKYLAYLEGIKDEWGDFSRYIKQQNGMIASLPNREDKIPLYKEKLEKLEVAFNELKLVHKVITENEKRLKLCYSSSGLGCGVQRRVELEQEVRALEVYKAQLLDESRWLGNENLGQFLEAGDKKALLSLLSENFANYFKFVFATESEVQNQLSQFKAENEVKPFEQYTFLNTNYLRGRVHSEPIYYNLFDSWASKDEGTREVICNLVQRKMNVDSNMKIAHNTATFGLVGLSLLPTPYAAGLKVARGFNFGRTIGYVSQSNLTLDMLARYNAKKPECDQFYVNHIVDSDKSGSLDDYVSCLSEENEIKWGII